MCRSQWPRGLSCEFAVAELLESRRGMDACECCVLSGTGISVGLITHPE